jgi:hypothetical protein
MVQLILLLRLALVKPSTFTEAHEPSTLTSLSKTGAPGHQISYRYVQHRMQCKTRRCRWPWFICSFKFSMDTFTAYSSESSAIFPSSLIIFVVLIPQCCVTYRDSRFSVRHTQKWLYQTFHNRALLWRLQQLRQLCEHHHPLVSVDTRLAPHFLRRYYRHFTHCLMWEWNAVYRQVRTLYVEEQGTEEITANSAT